MLHNKKQGHYYKEVYALDLSDGVLDSKECDTEVNHISSKAYKVDEVEVYNSD